jgi:hypothetical protein
MTTSVSVNGYADETPTTFELRYGTADPVLVELEDPSGRRFSAESTDLFNALLALRRELEPRGIRLCIAGARADVWPSGMAGQMGAGRSAYQHVKGRRPQLVDILSPAPCSEVASVEAQLAEQRLRTAPPRELRRNLPRATEAEAAEHPGSAVYDFDDVYGPDDVVDFRNVRGIIPVSTEGRMEDVYWPNHHYEGDA